MRILLVEDDVMIGESLQKALSKSGYSIDWVQDGADVEVCITDSAYALAILDLGLPNKDGLQILKDLRASKDDMTVLVLTARDSVSDRVLGLDSGADDYMLKPFALEELEARIRLLVRRKENRKTNELSVGPLRLNTSTHEVIYNNQNCVLSSKEFALMQLLMGKPQQIFSRSQLEESLYGWNEEVESNSVEVHIHQIRKKLGKDVIKNTRNVGYSIGLSS